jgi:hypothetical protein
MNALLGTGGHRAGLGAGPAVIAAGSGRVGDRCPGGLETLVHEPNGHRAFPDRGRSPLD